MVHSATDWATVLAGTGDLLPASTIALLPAGTIALLLAGTTALLPAGAGALPPLLLTYQNISSSTYIQAYNYTQPSIFLFAFINK